MDRSDPPAQGPQEIAKLRPQYRMFVDGKFVEGGGVPAVTVNPATEEVLAEVSTASTANVDTAVRAARRAYERVWSRLPGPQRAKYLFRVAGLVEERAQELAVLESLDTGAPISASRDLLVPAAAARFFHHAGWADKLGYAGYGPDPRPLGVAGQVIAPFPALLLAAEAIAPALTCGNTVVLTPAAATPLSALALAEICQQAELPPGVVNVLPGAGDDVGTTLAGHSGIDTVAFTGAAEVGRRIKRELAGTGRRLTLAPGGPATTIVFDDAPIEHAVDAVVATTFGATTFGATTFGATTFGARALGARSRLLVQESIAEQLRIALRAKVATLRVGDPLDTKTDVGALTSREFLERTRELADRAQADGAQRWTSPGPLPDRGFFFSPTMFTEVSHTMRIATEEIVGPVLPVLTFRTPDEAVALANSTPAGRYASVWTDKGSAIRWATQRIRAEVLWANTGHRVDPTAPFGGCRQPDACGRAELAEYLDG